MSKESDNVDSLAQVIGTLEVLGDQVFKEMGHQTSNSIWHCKATLERVLESLEGFGRKEPSQNHRDCSDID